MRTKEERRVKNREGKKQYETDEDVLEQVDEDWPEEEEELS